LLWHLSLKELLFARKNVPFFCFSKCEFDYVIMEKNKNKCRIRHILHTFGPNLKGFSDWSKIATIRDGLALSVLPRTFPVIIGLGDSGFVRWFRWFMHHGWSSYIACTGHVTRSSVDTSMIQCLGNEVKDLDYTCLVCRRYCQ
jgi:hypothetical protein